METIKKKISHTPGPWLVIYDDDEDKYEVIQKPDGKPGILYIAKEICQGYDNGDADAKLIAAAPEMLRCLKNVMHTKPHKASIEAMKKLIESVIKKATE